MEELDKRLILERPSDEEVINVEVIIEEIAKGEDDLIKPWNNMMSLLTDEREIGNVVESKIDMKTRILSALKAKQYLASHRHKQNNKIMIMCCANRLIGVNL